MIIPKIELLNRNTIREKYISINYPEFYQYVIKHYSANLKWTEKLYWYYHGLTKQPTCIVCGHPVSFINFNEGYRNYCSTGCMYKSDIMKEKRKQTFIKNYGVEHPSQANIIKKKKNQTFNKKYGVDSPFQILEIQEKIKQGNIKLYGVDNPFKSKEIQNKIKQVCIKKYGVDNYCKTREFKNVIMKKILETNRKSYLTKKQNHSFNTSTIEESFASWLDSQNIDYIRQYRSEKYPFSCDFYFPDKDLYLEIQGMWTHGDHPYDENNEDDIKTLESWKEKNTTFYNNAIKVWTQSDPIKRQWARDHNLNWVEVFSNDLDGLIKIIKES